MDIFATQYWQLVTVILYIDRVPYKGTCSHFKFKEEAIICCKEKRYLPRLMSGLTFHFVSGNASETCYTKYGAISLKSKCCHEIGLRIVLQCIEANANKYGRYIVSSFFPSGSRYDLFLCIGDLYTDTHFFI